MSEKEQSAEWETFFFVVVVVWNGVPWPSEGNASGLAAAVLLWKVQHVTCKFFLCFSRPAAVRLRSAPAPRVETGRSNLLEL